MESVGIYYGERELEEGLILMGWTSEEKPIRYEKGTNRIFNKIEDGSYLALGKLVTLIDLPNGSAIPIVSKDYTLPVSILQHLNRNFPIN
jgi:hypothetical protein